MSSPTILFYAPGPVPWASRLPSLCAVQRLRLRVLGPVDLDRPLSALAQSLPSASLSSAGEPLFEPVMVFCHLSEAQLDRALLSLRRLKVFCLKAVLTPSNKDWTLRFLYDELSRERQQFSS